MIDEKDYKDWLKSLDKKKVHDWTLQKDKEIEEIKNKISRLGEEEDYTSAFIHALVQVLYETITRTYFKPEESSKIVELIGEAIKEDYDGAGGPSIDTKQKILKHSIRIWNLNRFVLNDDLFEEKYLEEKE